MQYIEHKAHEGERWDHIALAYYGAGADIRTMIRDNPQYSGVLQFKGGEVIRVRKKDQASHVPSQNLPEWKR